MLNRLLENTQTVCVLFRYCVAIFSSKYSRRLCKLYVQLTNTSLSHSPKTQSNYSIIQRTRSASPSDTICSNNVCLHTHNAQPHNTPVVSSVTPTPTAPPPPVPRPAKLTISYIINALCFRRTRLNNILLCDTSSRRALRWPRYDTKCILSGTREFKNPKWISVRTPCGESFSLQTSRANSPGRFWRVLGCDVVLCTGGGAYAPRPVNY